MQDPGGSEEERLRQKTAQMRTCQTLVTVAIIGAPVSLLFGGVLLSVAALVCAVVAFAKMRRVLGPEDVKGSLARTLYVQASVALFAGAAATALNAAAFAYAFGIVMQAVQGGDVSALFDSFGASGQGPQPSGSIWD